MADTSVSLSRRNFVTAASVVMAGTVGMDGASTAVRATEDRAYEWRGYHGENTSGRSNVPGIQSYEEGWSLEAEDGSIPTVVDETAYFGADKQLYAVDLYSGAGKWTYRSEETFVGSTAVGEEVVVGITDEDSVVALDRSNGEKRWQQGLRADVGFPTVADGTVYAGDAEGTVYALDAEDGSLEWTADLDADPRIRNSTGRRTPLPAVTVDGDSLYVNLSGSGTSVAALDTSGSVEWEVEFDDYESVYPVAVDDDFLCVTSFHDSFVTVLSKDGGIEQWSAELFHDVMAPATIGHGRVAVVTDNSFTDPTCFVFDREDGEELWSYTIDDGNSPRDAVITEETVYFGAATGSRDSKLVAVGIDSGLEQFTFEYSNPGTDHGYVPIPDGLLVHDGGGVTALLSEAVTESTVDETASDHEQTNSDDGDVEDSTTKTGAATDDSDTDTGGSDEATTNADTTGTSGFVATILNDLIVETVASAVAAVVLALFGGQRLRNN